MINEAVRLLTFFLVGMAVFAIIMALEIGGNEDAEDAMSRKAIGHDGIWIGVEVAGSRYAGAYTLGDRDMILVWFVERPPWYQRLLMRWLLGWRWLEVGDR